MKKKYTFGMFLLDFILTCVTGGLWLIFLAVRYVRTH